MIAQQAECVLLEKHIQFRQGFPTTQPTWDCQLTSDIDVVAAGNRRFVQIDGLPDEVKAKARSGRTTLLPGSRASIDGRWGRLKIPPGTQIAMGNHEYIGELGQRPIASGGPEYKGKPGGVDGEPSIGRHRRLNWAALGDKQTIVVWVNNTSSDGIQSVTSLDKSTLSDRVFGTGTDVVNLRSQYKACSVNGTDFVPLSDSRVGNESEAGIVTINTTVALTAGDNSYAMSNAVTNQLESLFGSPEFFPFDHALICAPPGTIGAIAWAYLNYWLSIYNDDWCQEVSVQMHEIGHNLGKSCKPCG